MAFESGLWQVLNQRMSGPQGPQGLPIQLQQAQQIDRLADQQTSILLDLLSKTMVNGT